MLELSLKELAIFALISSLFNSFFRLVSLASSAAHTMPKDKRVLISTFLGNNYKVIFFKII